MRGRRWTERLLPPALALAAALVLTCSMLILPVPAGATPTATRDGTSPAATSTTGRVTSPTATPATSTTAQATTTVVTPPPTVTPTTGSGSTTTTAAVNAPAVTAKASILIDVDSSRILQSNNANARRAIASTTKIMTALVALESLSLDTRVTASAKTAATGESQIYLDKGEVLTVEQLLYALLVKSANDAAVALAEASAGSVAAFAEKMNRKAAALGLQNTHFVNPHGLDVQGHYSSARDLATLAAYAMLNPEFRKLVATKTYTIPWPGHDSPRSFTNRNLLLQELDWITGIKTGYTGKAGYCLVASGTKKGASLISVVLGEPTQELCWSDSRNLLEYGFSLYHHPTLLSKGVTVTDLPVPYQLTRRLRLVADSTFSPTLFHDNVVTHTMEIDKRVVLPVSAGEVFGAVHFWIDGKPLGSVDVVAADSFETPTLREILAYWRGLGPPLRLVTLYDLSAGEW